MALSNNRLNFASNPYGDTASMNNPLFSAPEKAQVPKKMPTVESSIGNSLNVNDENKIRERLAKKIEEPVFGTGKTSKQINEETGSKLLSETINTLGSDTGKDFLKQGVEFLQTAKALKAVKAASDLSKATTGLKMAEPLSKALTPAVDAGMKAVDLGTKSASSLAGTTAALPGAATTATNAATTATTAATTGAKVAEAGSKLSNLGSLGSMGLSLGAGLLGTGISMWGDNQEQKSLNRADLKGYGWSQAAKYGGMGLSLGSSIGSIFGPVGTLIGGGIGAGLGAIGGGIYGYFNKKKILKERAEEQKRVSEANARIKEENYVTMTQYRDQLKQKNFADQVNNLGNAMAYKRGGILLKYADVSDAVIIEETVEPKKLKEVPIFKMGGKITSEQESYIDFGALNDEDKDKYLQAVYELSQKGEDPVSISKKTKLNPKVVQSIQEYFSKMAKEQQQEPATPEYKKGGKVMLKKKVQSCDCGCTPKFKRGGTLDLKKEHVIVNGPSHDEYNKTGVKGDRGLPVVKMTKGGQAFKVAEIESDELVLGKNASDKLRKLKEQLSSHKDQKSPEHNKIKEAIAELLHSELANNTYDYSNLMS